MARVAAWDTALQLVPMSRAYQDTCDFCGKAKGEVNHWYRLKVTPHGTLIILPSVGQPENSTIKDACGSSCVSQGVSRFLDHKTLEPK